MGSHKTLGVAEEFKTQEGFYKWFLEIEPKLFQDSSSDDIEKQRRIERVKKYMISFSDLDILLELAEDERNDTNFVCENNPLDAFAVLGAIAFFNFYVDSSLESLDAHEIPSLNSVITFLEKYKTSRNVNTEYLNGMKYVIESLNGYYCQSSKCLQRAGIDGVKLSGDDQGKENAVVLNAIKLHFLQGFCDPRMLTNIRQLLDKILQSDTDNAPDTEWNLQQYYAQRLFRLHKCSQKTEFSKPHGFEELNDEKIALEIASRTGKASGKTPRLLLAKCQFLCDFLASSGPSVLEFLDEKFETHSEIVTFIRNSAEAITKNHPSFLRANFTFAEIFANELPITKQDREFAKSLLLKALEANPASSKINHKMGLFLIKGRQFSEAANYLQRAAQLDPNGSQAYHSLVKLLLRDPVTNKERLEDFFNIEYPLLLEILGPETELSFWKGCYFFKMGETEPAINVWTETILEFYVAKPELDLDSVLPFKDLSNVSKRFLWTKSNLTLDEIATAVKNASSQEKSRRRVVFHRLQDIVNDAMKC